MNDDGNVEASFCRFAPVINEINEINPFLKKLLCIKIGGDSIQVRSNIEDTKTHDAQQRTLFCKSHELDCGFVRSWLRGHTMLKIEPPAAK